MAPNAGYYYIYFCGFLQSHYLSGSMPFFDKSCNYTSVFISPVASETTPARAQILFCQEGKKERDMRKTWTGKWKKRADFQLINSA
jgi:hypothetical protein